MLDARHTVNKYLEHIIAESFPGINFYPEPDKQQIAYPCIIAHWGGLRHTTTLAMWSRDLQLDILFTGFQTTECDRTMQQLLEILHLAADNPGLQRRIPKIQYVDPLTGQPLNQPDPYRETDSDIQYRLNGDIESIDEADMPELKRNMIPLQIRFKNR